MGIEPARRILPLIVAVLGVAGPPSAAEWYVVCEPASGHVLATQAVDEGAHIALVGPLPGPRTASLWIEENCPDRLCDTAGSCLSTLSPPANEPTSGGWIAGELITVGTGASAAAPPAPAAPTEPATARGGDPLAPLIETAKAAAAACAYPAALAAADHLTNFDPEHPWLLANHATIRRLAKRQETTEQQVWEAAGELERGRLERARELAFAAIETAVGCQTPVVSQLITGIDTAIEQRKQMNRAKRQQFAAAALPSLISLARVAGGGGPDPETLASTVISEIQSTAAKFGGVDPCAFRLEYTDSSSLMPSCSCPGYRFDPGRFRCAP